jgi:hypothetical protein
VLFVLFLYSWLLTPVEPEHHPPAPSGGAGGPSDKPMADSPFWAAR